MKAIFWPILAVAFVIGALAVQSMLTDDQTEEIPEELLLSELRQTSLSEGKIFDKYLVPYEMSPAFVEHFGGVEQARSSYNHINELLEDSKGNPHMEKLNGFHMLTTNFGVLTDTVVNSEKIAALVIHESKLAETYQQPRLEPLQKLHAYLETEYPVGVAGQTLEEMFGSMSALAPEMLEIVEMKTLLGKPPYDMRDADLQYWAFVGSYGDCEMINDGNNCNRFLEDAKARAWERP